MLVLSRQAQEKIVFPGLGISVQVLRCSQRNVRIGIDAPRDIAVLRGELAEEKGLNADIVASRDFARLAMPNLKQTIHEAAATLNQLHALSEASADNDTEASIFALFGHLKSLDLQVAALTPTQPAKTQSVRALLVDDNDNESRLLSSYLKIKGIEVTVANNGQTALECMSKQQHDIVLLDMAMPQFDGRWTIDQIRGDHDLEKTTVFAVSGTDEADSDVEVGPQGVNGWFRKPLNPDDLILEITNSCMNKQAVLN